MLFDYHNLQRDARVLLSAGEIHAPVIFSTSFRHFSNSLFILPLKNIEKFIFLTILNYGSYFFSSDISS